MKYLLKCDLGYDKIGRRNIPNTDEGDRDMEYRILGKTGLDLFPKESDKIF